MVMEHRTEVRQQVDGDYLSFWAFCSCGWKDHRGRESRIEAENEADDHVVAATQGEP